MKLGIVSDVQGNAASLERALDLMPEVDELRYAGRPGLGLPLLERGGGAAL